MSVTLSRDEFELIRALAENAGMSARPNYSGRGMFDKTCLGVTGSTGQCVNFTLALATHAVHAERDQEDVEVGADPNTTGHTNWASDLVSEMQVAGARVDDMGRDLIFYWPTVQVA